MYNANVAVDTNFVATLLGIDKRVHNFFKTTNKPLSEITLKDLYKNLPRDMRQQHLSALNFYRLLVSKKVKCLILPTVLMELLETREEKMIETKKFDLINFLKNNNFEFVTFNDIQKEIRKKLVEEYTTSRNDDNLSHKDNPFNHTRPFEIEENSKPNKINDPRIMAEATILGVNVITHDGHFCRQGLITARNDRFFFEHIEHNEKYRNELTSNFGSSRAFTPEKFMAKYETNFLEK